MSSFRHGEPLDFAAFDRFPSGQRIRFAPLLRGDAALPAVAAKANTAQNVVLRAKAAAAILSAVVVAVAVLAVPAFDVVARRAAAGALAVDFDAGRVHLRRRVWSNVVHGCTILRSHSAAGLGRSFSSS